MTRQVRLLQAGFLLVAVACVVVADLTADRLAVLDADGPAASFVAVGGRVAGGFAVGLALRLQHRRALRPDATFRLAAGLPCAIVAAAPSLLAAGPWVPTGPVVAAIVRLAPFAGAVLGVVLALSVRSGR